MKAFTAVFACEILSLCALTLSAVSLHSPPNIAETEHRVMF